ncbi:hypothetical protein MBLNU457_1373t1 [Dothideomycetes sp. NU457]
MCDPRLSADAVSPSLDQDSQAETSSSSEEKATTTETPSILLDERMSARGSEVSECRIDARESSPLSSSPLSITDSSPASTDRQALAGDLLDSSFEEAPRGIPVEARASSPLSSSPFSDSTSPLQSQKTNASRSTEEASASEQDLSLSSAEDLESSQVLPESSTVATEKQIAIDQATTLAQQEARQAPTTNSQDKQNPHVEEVLTFNDRVYQRGSDRKRKQPQRFGYLTPSPEWAPPPKKKSKRSKTEIIEATPSSETLALAKATKKKKSKRQKTEVIQATPSPEIADKPSRVVRLSLKPEALQLSVLRDHENDRTGAEDVKFVSQIKTSKDKAPARTDNRKLSSLLIPASQHAHPTPFVKNEPGDLRMNDFTLHDPAQDNPSSELSSYCESLLSHELDPHLLQLSRQIMLKTAIEDKPLPRGRPRVWANCRQALCETVLYYQAWQGACYISKGVLYSFMFDNNGHSRDLIDNDVVIARAGGGMTREATGEMMQSKDQKDNSQSQAVKAAISQQNPIVIFVGSHNTDAPSKLPYRYNSLSWYKPTHIWSEKVFNRKGQAHEIIKYRFEKLDTSEQGWWCPADSDPVKVGDLAPSLEDECKTCKTTHQQVYLEGWMCLNAECEEFWVLPDGTSPQDVINYDPRFLKQKTSWPHEVAPFDLRPSLPDPAAKMGEDVTYAMTRGMCCPECGKCTSRYLWKGWICSGCGFKHTPQHIIIPALTIRDPWHPVSYGYSQCHDWAERQYVKTTVSFSHNYHVVHYEIEGVEGRISHLIANKTVNEESQGPDEMFEALQNLDVGLERRRFTTGKEDFMTAFSCNHGMPYKFVASVDSQSFDGAPWPLTETRSRLNWAARTTVNDLRKNEEFNELLTIGYFDGQNIKYHDDGEEGLGETVASLSLGHPADMSFRIKRKHLTGVSKSGTFIDKMPIPGTNQYEARRSAYEDLHTILRLDAAGRKDRLRSLAKELDLKDVCKDRKAWIRLRLSHGDIVVMHGRAIQEYLEHQVDPMGRLRFAMTARTIMAHHLKPDELPAYEVGPDNGGYDGSRIAELKTS